MVGCKGVAVIFNTNFTIQDKTIGHGCSPYVIAEMACAHNGSVDKAKAIVDAAVQAGVDAIQLQLFSSSHQVPPNHQIFELLTQIELTSLQWKKVFKHVRQHDIALFAFTYDIPSMLLALELGIDGMKLSSADLSNPEMLEVAGKSQIPLTLGTGASTIDEISQALDHVGDNGGDQVVLMHGVQNFPTAVEDANLCRIRLLRRTFGLPVGYQDHTAGDDRISKVIDLAALGMGACIIEKHITLDRSAKETDYQASLEPDELKCLVSQIRRVWAALGSDKDMSLTESDKKYRRFQKKNIVAIRNISAGQIIERNMVAFLRSSTPGLAPDQVKNIIGKIARVDIDSNENISLADLQNNDPAKNIMCLDTEGQR
ncbi:MAG TPA: hypothetical protein ENH94_03845 [Phycisphaerales bacterium]|nr:hypothetical protein [Phycisphaerales bacterium]